VLQERTAAVANKPTKPRRGNNKKDINRKTLMSVSAVQQGSNVRNGGGTAKAAGKGASQSATDLPLVMAYSMADLGARIAIYSFRYDFHYPCTIVGFDHRRNMHCVLYDDGGESGVNGRQWYDLRTKKIKRVDILQDVTGGRAANGKKKGAKKLAAASAADGAGPGGAARESATAPV
jgi:hypothetical protein